MDWTLRRTALGATLAALSLTAFLLLADSAAAQRPGIPPFRPPTMPGPGGTMPGPGGTMPGAGAMPPGGFGGGGFGGGFEERWYCSGCGATLGYGPFKPSLSTCPSCGAKFRNGGFDMTSPVGPGAGAPPMAPPASPPSNPPPQFGQAPPASPPGGFVAPGNAPPTAPPPNLGGVDAANSPSPAGNSTPAPSTNGGGLSPAGRLALGMVGAVIALGLIIGSVIMIVLRMHGNNSRDDDELDAPVRRRRRVPLRDD